MVEKESYIFIALDEEIYKQIVHITQIVDMIQILQVNS